jgi:hypothetical protein
MTAEEAEREPRIVASYGAEPPPLREILAGADPQPPLPTLDSRS